MISILAYSIWGWLLFNGEQSLVRSVDAMTNTTDSRDQMDQMEWLHNSSLGNNSSLGDYSEKKSIIDHYFKIGNSICYISEYLSRGSEGVIYLAYLDSMQVIVKGFIDVDGIHETFDTELFVLQRLERIIDWDAENLLIVQEKIEGIEFAEILENYASNYSPMNYPSDHIPKFLHDEFFQILYDFRNNTGLAHNDFHPYNIIGGTVIDFGRTERLSDDPIKRAKQIKEDDSIARGEWVWFYQKSDSDAIQINPKLPDAIKRSKLMWKSYFDRYYDTPSENELYMNSWMETLEENLRLNESFWDFPHLSDFYT